MATTHNDRILPPSAGGAFPGGQFFSLGGAGFPARLGYRQVPATGEGKEFPPLGLGHDSFVRGHLQLLVGIGRRIVGGAVDRVGHHAHTPRTRFGDDP